MKTSQPACLVTGCAGFVGSHITDALLSMGYPVAGVDIKPRSEAHNLSDALQNPLFRYLEHDITDHGVLARCAAEWPNIQHIFHLAAVVMVAFSMEHPELTMATNFTATQAMHEDARKAGVSSFLFAGSAAEYGDDPRLPLKEEYASDSTVHNSPYGRSKYLSSSLMKNRGYGCSLRFFNIFGPRQDPSSPYSGVVSKFITQAVANGDLTIFGDGGQTRDFIYVSDVVHAYLIAGGVIPNPATGRAAPLSGIYNVGTGLRISINELAQKTLKAAGASSPIHYATPRAGDIYHSQADVSLFRAATSFSAEIPFDEGLARTVKWMKNA